MDNIPLLSIVTFLPLAGVVFILLARGQGPEVERNVKYIALWTTLATFVLSLFILIGFDPAEPGFQMVERHPWIPALGIDYIKGVDGISIWFVLASTFLTPICVLASWEAIRSRIKEFMVALLALETMMVGMFTALDLVLFYLFFEAVLIPMFLIIGVWGGPKRVYAAYKFFLYTLVGSVLMLLAILYMALTAGTTDITQLVADPAFGREAQLWLWLAFFASFAVKTPIWPFHTWLPYAHVEAPTAGSVLLAGVLLKMGGYGFIRFSIEMLPEASAYFAPLMFGLSIAAIIYTSLVAWVQEDMKKLIAYSSVAHMGFVTLGLFTLTKQGMEGAILVMISHTLVSSALFLCVGVAYDRLHTREIGRYGGMIENMPKYAFIFMVFTLASIGLPGTSGFVGEFMALLGAYQVSSTVGFLATTGVVLSAVYMLTLYRRLFLGPLVHEDVKVLKDVNLREISYFAPLIAIVLFFGIQPNAFKDYVSASVDQILLRNTAALQAAEAPSRGEGEGARLAEVEVAP